MSTMAPAPQAGELADPQPGPRRHLDSDPHQHPAVGLAARSSREHRHLRRGLVPAPLLDVQEEHPQRAEAVRDRGRGQPRPVAYSTGSTLIMFTGFGLAGVAFGPALVLGEPWRTLPADLRHLGVCVAHRP